MSSGTCVSPHRRSGQGCLHQAPPQGLGAGSTPLLRQRRGTGSPACPPFCGHGIWSPWSWDPPIPLGAPHVARDPPPRPPLPPSPGTRPARSTPFSSPLGLAGSHRRERSSRSPGEEGKRRLCPALALTPPTPPAWQLPPLTTLFLLSSGPSWLPRPRGASGREGRQGERFGDCPHPTLGSGGAPQGNPQQHRQAPTNGIGLTRLLCPRRENRAQWVLPARRVPWVPRALLGSRAPMVSEVCPARW